MEPVDFKNEENKPEQQRPRVVFAMFQKPDGQYDLIMSASSAEFAAYLEYLIDAIAQGKDIKMLDIVDRFVKKARTQIKKG